MSFIEFCRENKLDKEEAIACAELLKLIRLKAMSKYLQVAITVEYKKKAGKP